MKEARLFEIVAEALELEVENVSLDTSTENVEEWDSLGHITILSALDDETGGETSELPDLTQAVSVRELLEVLKANDMINA